MNNLSMQLAICIDNINSIKTEKITSQVAHDIKSPLGALKSIIHDFPEMQNEKKMILETVVQRISDISNDILSKKDLEKNLFKNSHFKQFIKDLISEKRLKKSRRQPFQIIAEFTSFDFQSIPDTLDRVQLARVLSNIIDNSIDALQENGKIVIHISKNSNNLMISISDNGTGIDPKILPQLGKEGFSFEKINGYGLGLYSGKEWLKQLGGCLDIQSQLNQGTTVTLTIPCFK